MNITCLNSNVVFVFDKPTAREFEQSEIETVIRVAFPDIDHNFAQMNFGESKSLYSTSLNIQVTARDQLLLITSAKIHESNTYNDNDFLRVAFLIQKKMLDKNLIARHTGFNFSFISDRNDISENLTDLQAKFFSGLALEADEVARYAVPNISFNKGDATYVLNYQVEIDENNNPTRIAIDTNAHREGVIYTEQDGLEKLSEAFKTDYTYLRSIVSER